MFRRVATTAVARPATTAVRRATTYGHFMKKCYTSAPLAKQLKAEKLMGDRARLMAKWYKSLSKDELAALTAQAKKKPSPLARKRTNRQGQFRLYIKQQFRKRQFSARSGVPLAKRWKEIIKNYWALKKKGGLKGKAAKKAAMKPTAPKRKVKKAGKKAKKGDKKK